MKQFYYLLIPALFGLQNLRAQTGYDIKINFKGCTDTTVYLAKYFFDQMPIADSCKNIKNGKIQFKGKTNLERGVYFLASQSKSSYYCQFIVDNNQKFTINLDQSDMGGSLKTPDDKQNEQFFAYVRFMTSKNKELAAFTQQLKGKKKEDSIKLASEKQLAIHNEMTKYDLAFKAATKGMFVNDLMNLKTEKYPTEVPKASNGRPDSIYQYYYYKDHYFDGINFKDDRIIHTPFFADKVKKYFEHMVIQHPDSVIKELDKILMQCVPGSIMFNTLVGHFTHSYEQNKSMSFDQYGKSNTFEKVFIHLSDKYIISGKTQGYYSAETIVKIKERVDVLRNLLPGAKVPNLFMIDTTYGRTVLKMGFDTAKSSESVTYLYNQNINKLAPMYKTLYDIKGKYTILVFWAADCGHCQTEVPKLHENLKKMQGKTDVKVYAVQTKEELFDTWKKFLVEKKLNDFVHVFDPIHLNNLKEQFDIVATPVIYLLDKDKKIIGKKLASEQVIEIIEKLEEIETRLKEIIKTKSYPHKMKKLLLVLAAFILFTQHSTAAEGYDIRINIKGCKDTIAYLVKYNWDQQFVVDTCKNFKNGQIVFKGNKPLDKGMYILVSQATVVYFEFFINDSQKLNITTDISDPGGSINVTGSKENEMFFSYLKFVSAKNKEFGKVMEQSKGKSKDDSLKFVQEKVKAFMAEAKQFDADFMQKTKGTFVYDFMNLKTEKEPTEVPKASNGRPDSIYSYYYYKGHYFDGINFQDERIIRTPLFDDRIKNYFDRVIVNHPDTVIQEIDKILAKCIEGSQIYNQLLGYFTYKYEQSKIIGFDKVFVHLGRKYIIPGKAKGVYTEETVVKIKERVEIMGNLLMDAKVADLYMIDTTYGKVVRKLGFDTASTSKSITELYLKHADKLTPMYKTLYQVNAKYTILVFWAADCGHCQTEVPKLHENLNAIKGKIDHKVFAVQTKDELFDTWRKFLIDKKLSDFIHVYDPIHINNLKERFDIYSTPVIYILDKDKKIKAKRLGAEQVVDYLKFLESQEKPAK